MEAKQSKDAAGFTADNYSDHADRIAEHASNRRQRGSYSNGERARELARLQGLPLAVAASLVVSLEAHVAPESRTGFADFRAEVEAYLRERARREAAAPALFAALEACEKALAASGVYYRTTREAARAALALARAPSARGEG
jgi:hypothetical protein